MTQAPAGWYADPDPTATPGRLRYWDGAQWTEHLHEQQPVPPPPQYSAPYPPQYPPAYPQQAPQQPSPQPYPGTYGQQGYQTYQVYQPQRPTTPDGVPLSGWWWRVLAQILDGFISLPLSALLVAPIVVWQWSSLTDWFDNVRTAADLGASRPARPPLFDVTTTPGILFILALLLGNVIYQVIFLRWKQATPGKLILGLRIRRRETPGPLPWATIGLRVGFVLLLSLAGQIPLAGALFVLLGLLDYLWPLWDSKNQALHDKVAGTNVIKPV